MTFSNPLTSKDFQGLAHITTSRGMTLTAVVIGLIGLTGCSAFVVVQQGGMPDRQSYHKRAFIQHPCPVPLQFSHGPATPHLRPTAPPCCRQPAHRGTRHLPRCFPCPHLPRSPRHWPFPASSLGLFAIRTVTRAPASTTVEGAAGALGAAKPGRCCGGRTRHTSQAKPPGAGAY